MNKNKENFKENIRETGNTGNSKRIVLLVPFVLFHTLIIAFDLFAPRFYSGANLYDAGYQAIFELSLILLFFIIFKIRNGFDISLQKAFFAAYVSLFLIYGEIIISILLLI